MKKLVIAMAVLAAFNTYAAQTNEGCQGNCPTTGGTTTNQGGAGGNGYGGNGFGTGIGIGGSATAVGGTSVSTGGSVLGSGNSSAIGGSVSGSGNSNNRNELNQHQQQSSNNKNNNQSNANNSLSNLSTSGSTGNSTNVVVQGDNVRYEAARIPVATAYAPNIAPTAVCMGSTTAGAQGMSFGVSLGTSWTDSNCMLLEQVRTVSVVLGQKEVAAEMMMAIPAYAEAVNRLRGKTEHTAVVTDVPMGAGIQKVSYNEQDPIIRARLNLPPLK